MQLGARWKVGDPPHPGVPAALHAAISETENASAAGASWTLTWLEGRPRVELLDAAGTPVAELRLGPDGSIEGGAEWDAAGGGADDDDDDWLV